MPRDSRKYGVLVTFPSARSRFQRSSGVRRIELLREGDERRSSACSSTADPLSSHRPDDLRPLLSLSDVPAVAVRECAVADRDEHALEDAAAVTTRIGRVDDDLRSTRLVLARLVARTVIAAVLGSTVAAPSAVVCAAVGSRSDASISSSLTAVGALIEAADAFGAAGAARVARSVAGISSASDSFPSLATRQTRSCSRAAHARASRVGSARAHRAPSGHRVGYLPSVGGELATEARARRRVRT